MLLSLVLSVAVAVLAVFFADANQAAAQITLYGWPIQGKLGTMLVLAFAIGALCGVAVTLPAYLAKAWALLRSRRKLEDLERTAHGVLPSDLKQV